MPDDIKIKKIRGDLNVVLSADQINMILESVLGKHGSKIDELALASDHCCVDAAVGSSVAGPVQGVASSVSTPGLEGRNILTANTRITKSKLLQKFKEQKFNANIILPENILIK